MTSLDWMLVNIGILVLYGYPCILLGYLWGIRYREEKWTSWSKGWEDCVKAIKEGLSEEGKELVDLYIGKDEENEDC